MPGIMADNDVRGQLKYLLRLIRKGTWGELWEDLKVLEKSFEDLGLSPEAPDVEIWKACQEHDVILFTGNRNLEGPDSLEAAIRTLNQPGSLPVITLSEPKRVTRDRDYAERVIDQLMNYLVYLENTLGAGRLYVP